MKNAKGFTLIELVIVIVILGILTATVAPKFANLQKDAKAATVKGLEGSIKAAANIVRAKWLAIDNVSVTSVDIDGDNTDNVDIIYNLTNHQLINGYPIATAQGILRAIDYDTSKFTYYSNNSTVYSGYIRIYYNGTSGTNGVNLVFDTDTADNACGVIYEFSNTAPYKPIIRSETGGC